MNLGKLVRSMPKLDMNWLERGLMLVTFVILVAVELMLAKTKHEALFFVDVRAAGGAVHVGLFAAAERGADDDGAARPLADIVKPGDGGEDVAAFACGDAEDPGLACTGYSGAAVCL